MKLHVNRPRKLVCLLLSLVMLLSLAAGLSGCGKTADLGDYISIAVEGYSGAGKASAHIDYDAFGQKYQVKEKLIKSLTKEYKKSGDPDSDIALGIGFAKLMDDGDAAEYLLEDELNLKTEFEKGTGLANGDQVVLDLSMSESSLKEVNGWLGVKIKYPTQITRTIGADELPKATTIDVSSYIDSVKFKGREGAGEVKVGLKDTQTNVEGLTVKVSNDDKTLKVSRGDELLKTFYIDLVSINGSSDSDTLSYTGWGSEKKYKLSNGDKVAIGVKDDLEGTEGFVLTNKTKKFTVKGLAGYLETGDEVPVKAVINDVKRRIDFSWLINRKYTVVFLKRVDSSAEYANRVVVKMDGTNTFLDHDYKDSYIFTYNNVYLDNGEFAYVGDVESHQYDEVGGSYQNLSAAYKELVNDDSYEATKLQ